MHDICLANKYSTSLSTPLQNSPSKLQRHAMDETAPRSSHMHKNKKHHHGSKIENNHINWSTLLDKSQSEVNGHAY